MEREFSLLGGGFFEARAFVRRRRPSYFLLRGQEKVTKEKTTPRLRALRASLPARSAVGLRGLSTGHPALSTNWPASLPTTLRADPPPARRCRGAPGRAARILRVLFRRARSRAPSPQPSPRLCRGEGAKRWAPALPLLSSSAPQLFSPSALQLFGSLALWLFALAAAQRLRTECGPGWPSCSAGAPVRR